jgi:hypothetical protein
VQVADGLTPTSCQFHVPERFAVEYPEVFAAFWRDIDMHLPGKRRCRYPEQLLFQNPWDQRLWYVLIEDPHGGEELRLIRSGETMLERLTRMTDGIADIHAPHRQLGTGFV